MAKTKKVVIKKLDIMSVAKLEAVLMAVMGLVMGIMIGVFGMAMGAMFGSVPAGIGVGLASIIAVPIFYGIMGFIAGAIGAWLYNMAAKWVGGIKIETA
jgi:hypothetical protein